MKSHFGHGVTQFRPYGSSEGKKRSSQLKVVRPIMSITQRCSDLFEIYFSVESDDFHTEGFPKWGYPKIAGLFHGKSKSKMDDWGYPHDLGNLHLFPPKVSDQITTCMAFSSSSARGTAAARPGNRANKSEYLRLERRFP